MEGLDASDKESDAADPGLGKTNSTEINRFRHTVAELGSPESAGHYPAVKACAEEHLKPHEASKAQGCGHDSGTNSDGRPPISVPCEHIKTDKAHWPVYLRSNTGLPSVWVKARPSYHVAVLRTFR